MRYIMALLLSLALAVPAFAGFEGDLMPVPADSLAPALRPLRKRRRYKMPLMIPPARWKGIFWNASAKTSMYFRMIPER